MHHCTFIVLFKRFSILIVKRHFEKKITKYTKCSSDFSSVKKQINFPWTAIKCKVLWAIKLYTIQISCLCPSTSRMTSKLGVVQFFLYNLYFHTDSNWIKNEAMGRHPESMWFLNSSHCLAQKQIRANMSIVYTLSKNIKTSGSKLKHI